MKRLRDEIDRLKSLMHQFADAAFALPLDATANGVALNRIGEAGKVIKELKEQLATVTAERDGLLRNHDISTCSQGHRFRTIASHPAKSEREWECPHCAVKDRDQWKQKAEGLEKERADLAHDLKEVQIANDDKFHRLEEAIIEIENLRLRAQSSGVLTEKVVESVLTSQDWSGYTQRQKYQFITQELNRRLTSPWRDVLTDPPEESDVDRNGNVEFMVPAMDHVELNQWNVLQLRPSLPYSYWRPTNLPPLPKPVVEDDPKEAFYQTHLSSIMSRDAFEKEYNAMVAARNTKGATS